MAFFGQAPQEQSRDLSEVCDNANFDIVILAFITSLNPPKLNMGKDTGSPSEAQTKAGLTELFDGTFTPDGKQSVADQIAGCQGKGKKIMVSFGGDERFSNATFESADEAKEAANQAWNLFLGGRDSEDLRPFGRDITLDGLDLDNESGDGSFYNEFVTELRTKMDADASREYLLSANPMCAVFNQPESSIPNSVFPMLDFISVQFYNNQPQGIGGADFESTIKTWAEKIAEANRPKIFLGIPGGPGAAGSNVQSPDEIKKTIESVKAMNLPGFGGVGIWDAAFAMAEDGMPEAVKGSLAV
ncbi:putative endochitinase chi3 [Cladorrhinum sp. PSN332]|nr:putative endochitinase chi3 [Cladorrhinum sp. PSN332]